MYNRAICRAASDFVLQRGGSVEVLCQNDSTAEWDRRYVPEAAGSFRGFDGAKARFALAALRSAASRPDRIFLGHAQYLPLGPLLRALSPRHLGCFLHGIESWERWTAASRLGARSCTEFFSVSEFTRERAIVVNRTGRIRIHVCHDTLDPYWQPPIRRSDDPPGNRILTVARLDARERYKGVDTVLEALPQIRRALPEAEYRVVGDGLDRPRLEEIASRLGVSESTHFLGRVDSQTLHREYAHCDLFVMPSAREGFGIVFLEAASYGKPSIGADAGGTPEVIRDGVTGALVPPRDPAALASAVIALLGDPARLSALGHAAHDDLLGRFTYPTFRSRFEKLMLPEVSGGGMNAPNALAHQRS